MKSMRDGLLLLSGLLLGLAAPLYYQKLSPDPWRLLADTGRRTLVLVYIGSPTCGPSNDPRLPSLMEAVRTRLSAAAVAQGIAFRVVGIAISRDVRSGLDHLEKVGPFHEIAAGARWHNLAMRYVQEVAPGLEATPQLILLDWRPDSVRPLLRWIGVDKMERWVEAGMPLPRLDDMAAQSQ